MCIQLKNSKYQLIINMVFTRETSRNDSLIKNSGDEDIKEELIQNNKNIDEETYVINDKNSKHSQKGCKSPCKI